MRNIILFDDDSRDKFLPLTYLRPVAELRMGVLTIREKWERWLEGKVSYITQEYLAEKFPIHIEEDNFIINASVLPNREICSIIRQLKENEAVLKNGELIATRLNEKQIERLIHNQDITEMQGYDLDNTDFVKLKHITDLFTLNHQAIVADFELLTHGRCSQDLNESNMVKGATQIFVEEGAEVDCCIINATTGPIYIGKNVKILEGCMLRGPIAFGENSIIKMGAKIYGATTFGPHSKMGGEINNSIIFGNSNKGHEGYLGNSIVGEWCNFGADTNISNLKNNYGIVSQWDYTANDFVPTGLQFCGLVMGDYSKCAINTAFNTGTVVGINANIFGAGFPPRFIPSFSWGGAEKMETYELDKAFEVAERMMARRNESFQVQDRLIMIKLFEETAKYRHWEQQEKAVNHA